MDGANGVRCVLESVFIDISEEWTKEEIYTTMGHKQNIQIARAWIVLAIG